MADKPLKSITFPGLADKYTIPEIDSTLTQQGEAADAKATGDAVDDVKNTLSHKADVIYDTASGDIASFPDGADGLPVKDLTVAIEPVQNLHGYNNPWPAGGGKNMLPVTAESRTFSGVAISINKDAAGNVISVVFNNTCTGTTFFELGTFVLSAETSVTLNGCPAGGNGSSTYNLRVVNLSGTTQISDYGYASTATLAAGTYKAIITVYNGYAFSNTTFYPMLRLSSVSDAAFAPYSNICPISGWTGCNISHSGADTSDPTVIPISWQSEAGTVYGGTLELPSCVLTVDRAGVDMGTLSWGYNSESVLFETTISDIRSGYTYSSDLSDIICSMFTAKSQWSGWSAMENGSFGVSVTSFRVKNTSYTSPSDFTTLVNGQTLIYPLATPQTYQLTQQEVITTILGRNNIWADCGPSTVEYPADTKLYIQKINAPADDDMIADANIASGQYFIVNNNLYLSTAAILAGDPIKPGTNCTLTNLAAALNALNS